jgi:hypothetical protein
MTYEDKLTFLAKDNFTLDDIETLLEILSEGRVDFVSLQWHDELSMKQDSLAKELAYSIVTKFLTDIKP